MLRNVMHTMVLLLLVAGVSAQGLWAQATNWRREVREFQKALNAQYRDPVDSPLDSLDRLHFRRHQFYPVRARYRVQARMLLTPDATPFEMPTVSGKTKTFVKVCMLEFELNGRKDTLCAYRNLKLAAQAEYADELFIPFRDHSSGFKSYGGGRYIDWNMPAADMAEGKMVFLNLNLCYNPYCAYSTGWNCPIPPDENYVDSEVHAGIRRWKHGHE